MPADRLAPPATSSRAAAEVRVLLLAPTVRDGAVSRQLLESAGIVCVLCPDVNGLCDRMDAGVGLLMLPEEAVLAGGIDRLADRLRRQPLWSDLGVILLSRAGGDAGPAERAVTLLGNVTVVERPVRVTVLVSTVRSALRARERQYQIRDHLVDHQRSAAALRASEDRLALAVAAADLGTFHWPLGEGSDGVEWNDVARSQFGLAAGVTVTRELFLEHVHPDDRDRVRAAVAAATAGQATYDVEYRVLDSGGAVRSIRAKGRAFADGNGRPARFDGVMLDVTEQRRQADALRASEAESRFLSELGEATRRTADPDAVLAVVVDRLRRHLRVDRCVYAEVDADQDWLTIRFDQADPGGSNRSLAGRHPLSAFGRLMADEPRAGRTVVVGDVTADPRVNDGREALAAVGVRALVNVPLVKDGRLVATLAVHEARPRAWTAGEVGLVEAVAERSWAEIERSRAGRALARSEAEFRQQADAMPQIVWAARPDGTVDYYNRRWREYTGRPPGEVGEPSWSPVIFPDDLPRVASAWMEAVRTGRPYDAECRFRRASDETYRWHLSRALPIRDAAGRIIRWIGTNTDVHDQKMLAELNKQLLASERSARSEAERQGRMKDEFLATLSHELRTPLNAILGWAQILRGDLDAVGTVAPVDLVEGLATIDRNARAQTQIIEDLLDMSRVISGKMHLTTSVVDPAAVVRAAAETVRAAAAAKGVRLAVSVPPAGLPVLTADLNRLQQVFWNLFSNAVKFTPRGGRVDGTVSHDDRHVIVRVADTGEGIRPDFLPYVFDRFRQADASTTRRHGGLGLGLAIVRQLVELHGGRVRVDSDGPGRGTTFTVELPVTSDGPVSEAGGSSSPAVERPELDAVAVTAARRRLAGVRVLAVDDEPDARAVIARLLGDAGAVVRTAGSVADALAAVAVAAVDVVVSDIGMPGADGFALLSAVRSAGGPRTPFVALTAFAHSSDRLKVLAAGFDAHVTKPIDPPELIVAVANAVTDAGAD